MTYIVRRVELENFISHGRTVLELGRGVTVFVGENGAGKSSIVDAVYMALTGDYSLRGRLANLVRRGAGRARVSVDLADDSSGHALRVVLEVVSRCEGGDARRCRAQSTARVYSIEDGRLRLVAHGGRSGAFRAVAEALGIPASILGSVVSHTLVFRQGSITALADLLASGRDREKSELLEEVLGVKSFREAGERLAELAVEVEGEQVEARVTAARRLRREAERERQRAREEASRAARLRRELERLLSEAARLEGELERLGSPGERLAAARERLAALEERLEAVRGEAAGLEELASRLEREAAELEARAAEAGRLRRLAGLAPLAERVRELERLLSEAVERLRAAREALADLAEYEGLRGAVELEARLEEELGRLEAGLSRVRGELEAVRARLAEARERLARAERLAARAAELAGVKPGPPAAVLEAVKARAGELEARAEGLEAEASRLEREAAEARARARDARVKAGLISGAAARCPLCGSPLPAGRAGELRRHLLSEAGELEARAERLEEQAREARAGAREARARAARLREAAAALEEAVRAAPEPGELEALEAEAARLEAEARRLEGEKARVEGELRRARADARRALAALERARARARLLGVAEEEAGALRGRLEELAGRLEAEARRLEGELEEARGRLAEEAGAGSPEEALRAVEEAVVALPSALEAERRLEAVRARLDEARARLEAARAEARRLEGELEEARRLVAELEGLAEEERRLRGELERLRREAGRLEGMERAAREAAREAEERAGRLERAAWQAEKLVKLADLMRNVIPKVLLSARLAVVEEAASGALRRFNTDYKAVFFRVDPDRGEVGVVLVSSAGEEVDPQSLSGGERVALALALASALARVSAVNAGFMILDEPTVSLDEERRRVLVEVLRGMAEGIPQVIVVTHDDEVRNAADVVYRVSKGPGGSVVEREEPGVAGSW